MKKICISMLLLVASMAAMAVSYTGKATLTLKSATGKKGVTVVAQSNDLNAGLNSGYCAPINMEDVNVAIYAIFGGKNYQTFGTKTLGEMPFGIKTNADTEYTITVSDAEGSLMLKDAVTGKTIKLVNGATYAFTAEANKTITDRFALTTVVPYEICYRYGALQITGYPASAANVVVKDAAGAEVKNVAITDHAYQEIDLSGLAAGHYTVEANGQTLTISVQ